MNDLDQKIRQGMAGYQVRYLITCYVLDENPMWLWAIWRTCRTAGIAVPSFVLEYLDGVADRLDPTSPNHSDTGRIENRVRDAVLGKAKIADTAKHVQIAREVANLSSDLNLSEGDVFDLADKYEVSDRTIHSWLKKARKLIRRS